MRKIVCVAVLFMVLVNCQNGGNDNGFEAYLANLQNIENSSIQILDTGGHSIYSPHILSVTDNGNLIVVDSSNWSLHLLDKDGNKKSEAGGMGNGPGEFQVINSLFIGADDRVLVLDKSLNRLTEYEIAGNSFVLKRTSQLPDYSPNRVETITFSDSYEYVGIFRERSQNEVSITPWTFIDLDNDLEISNELFSFPGNEVIQLNGVVHDDELGFQTKWHLYDETFTYSNSSTLSWTNVDLKSLDKDSVLIKGVPAYEKTKDEEEYIMDRMRLIIQAYPAFADVIRERKVLPYFFNVIKDSTHLYYSTLNFTGNDGTILQIDKSTHGLKSLNVPEMFVLHGVHENQLFGIDFNELEIVIINI